MVREVIALLDCSWKVTLLVSKCFSRRSYKSVLVMESIIGYVVGLKYSGSWIDGKS